MMLIPYRLNPLKFCGFHIFTFDPTFKFLGIFAVYIVKYFQNNLSFFASSTCSLVYFTEPVFAIP